jgi:PAS domain S-box-containing protein
MKKAPIGPNEKERLLTLQRYLILDTEAELKYDEITALAATICQTPIAAISLLDADRQWFKSCYGAKVTETPRDVSFCGHAVYEDDALYIEDTLKDERFSDNPFVTEGLKIRFYTGVPLIAKNGLVVGVLCVLDYNPRTLTKEQIYSLKVLAKQIISQLELTAAYNETIESNNLLNAVLQTLPVAVFAKDIKKEYQYKIWNKKAEEVFGIQSDSCIGKSDFDFFPEEQAKFFRQKDFEASMSESIIEIPEEPANLVHGLGYLHTRKVVVRDKDGLPCFLLGICEDITEKKKNDLMFEEQNVKVQASARMASLGEMAAGIAHEVNNPLSIVIGKADLIKIALSGPRPDLAKLETSLDKLIIAANRASKIILSMKSLSRNSEADPKAPAAISSVVTDSLDMCSERFKNSGIKLNVQLKDNPFFFGRPAQLGQVLINLLSNSYDEITSKQTENKWVKIESYVEGDYGYLTVTDSGPGVPSEIAEKIMQPFFTTKEIGKGTGLGLSISKRIIADHEGELSIDTKCPNTKFVIKLPLWTEAKAAA